MSVSSSSVNKGETLLDTAGTLKRDELRPAGGAARPVRRAEPAAQKVDASVINAGDGLHEHPTQALLDALTIPPPPRPAGGADRGDLRRRAAQPGGAVEHPPADHDGQPVRVVGPPTLIPAEVARLGVTVFNDMEAGLAGADIVMMLRLQRERMARGLVPSAREYFRFFGLDAAKLAKAAPDALVMHPGPMNRGVEIDSAVADDPVAQPDPRTGGNGRRRAHGGAGFPLAPVPAE